MQAPSLEPLFDLINGEMRLKRLDLVRYREARASLGPSSDYLTPDTFAKQRFAESKEGRDYAALLASLLETAEADRARPEASVSREPRERLGALAQ